MSRRLSLGVPGSPQNRQCGRRRKPLLNPSVGGRAGSCSSQPQLDGNPEACKRFTRMSLAGYSLAGRSPPEPGLRFTSRKNCANRSSRASSSSFIWIDLRCLRKRRLRRRGQPKRAPDSTGDRSPGDSAPTGVRLPEWRGGGCLSDKRLPRCRVRFRSSAAPDAPLPATWFAENDCAV